MLDFREHTPDNPLPPKLVDDVQRLYEKTAVRADLQFEHLNATYFRLTAPISHYLLAFESSDRPGWHPLEVRARDRDLTVRARSGYFAGQSRPISQ